MNRSSNIASVLARMLILLLLSSLLAVTSPAESDAQICTHGSLADTCVGDRYCYHGDDPLGCYPAPPVEPPINCNDRNLGLRPPATVRGSVRGPGGAGVKDACVYWKANWGWASTHSDAQGLFAIDVAADSTSTVIYVAKPYMTWASGEVKPLDYVTDPAKRLDLAIAFTNQAYIKPWAINSTVARELSVELYSAAPTETVRSLIEFEGVVVELTHDTGFNETWSGMPISRWKGSLHTSSGLSEGVRRYETCLLSSGTTGGCGSPDGTIYSPVPPEPLRALLAVDNTPPSQGYVSPKNLHNTTDATPVISVNAVDNLSGPDMSRTQIFLDGSSSPNGYWIQPSSPLALGVHSVTATIWDLAGNSSVASWDFAITALEGGPATVTVTPKTITVPQQSLPGFCCQYVTFSDIQTQLSESDLTLRGSPLWNGVGTASRYVSHQNLRVTFKSAAQEMTVAATGYSSYSYDIAVIEPNSEDLGVRISAKNSNIPYVGLYVPQGFILTNDTTATVWAEVENLVTSTVDPILNSDPLPDGFPRCNGAVTCTVTVISECEMNDLTEGIAGSNGSYNCSGTRPRSDLEIKEGSKPGAVKSVLGAIGDADSTPKRTKERYPSHNPANGMLPNCDRQNFSCTNLAANPSYNAQLTAYWYTGDLFRAYSHNYYFSVKKADDRRIMAWQISEVHPGTRLETPAGCLRGRTTFFANQARTLDPRWTLGAATTGTVAPLLSPVATDGPSKDVGPVESRRRVGDDDLFVYRTGSSGVGHNVNLTSVSRNGELLGSYELSTATVVTSPLDAPSSGVGAINFWRSYYNQEDQDANGVPADTRDDYAEVISGTEFRSGGGSGFNVRSGNYFRFGISSC